jgi:hypothetical protein
MTNSECSYWWGFSDALDIALRENDLSNLRELLKSALQKKEIERSRP